MAEYIDREKLKKIYMSKIKPGKTVDKLRLSTVINELEMMPKADVEPVRRGRWIVKDPEPNGNYCKYYQCTACDWTVYDVTADKYCPNCGARMENAE